MENGPWIQRSNGKCSWIQRSGGKIVFPYWVLSLSSTIACFVSKFFTSMVIAQAACMWKSNDPWWHLLKAGHYYTMVLFALKRLLDQKMYLLFVKIRKWLWLWRSSGWDENISQYNFKTDQRCFAKCLPAQCEFEERPVIFWNLFNLWCRFFTSSCRTSLSRMSGVWRLNNNKI